MSPSACGSTAIKGDIDERVEQALRARRALGRGQGQAQDQRPVAVRRPAAAPVHRPRHRHRAQRAADGRALLGARPDRHAAHRGADARAEEGLHDRDRDPQHAAGDARRRHHRVLLRRHLEGGRTGYLVEIGETNQIFENPREQLTKDYISGQFS